MRSRASSISPGAASAHASASSVKTSRAVVQLALWRDRTACRRPSRRVDRYRASVRGSLVVPPAQARRLDRGRLVDPVQQAERVGERPLVFGQRIEARRPLERDDRLRGLRRARAGCARAREAPRA